ncbi:MAG TPA: hypothetical protein VMV89_10610 [Candidatus Paceibacterota bacterium]|nr:hypothetical protein [Candidatus Paceibacterota bacterium]
MASIDPDLLHSNFDSLTAYITDNGTTLTAKGLNPATVQASLAGADTDLTAKKKDRDADKTALTISQQAYADSASVNYKTFSNGVDVVAGALGKETPAGKQVLQFRKNVTGADRHHAHPEPAPVAEPAK